MALNTRISNAAAIAACNAIVDLIDGGSGAGKLRIYSGSQPADPDTAAAGTLLAEITLNDPAFGNAVDATGKARATADVAPAIEDTSANATGTATWFRAVDSDDNGIIDGEIGTSGADMTLNTTAISAGATVSVTSWVVDMPES